MIVKAILDDVVKNKNKIYLDLDQQLLIYIKNEGKVGKIKVIQTIEIRFTFLGRRKKLEISASTIFVAYSIKKNMVHIALIINK